MQRLAPATETRERGAPGTGKGGSRPRTPMAVLLNAPHWPGQSTQANPNRPRTIPPPRPATATAAAATTRPATKRTGKQQMGTPCNLLFPSSSALSLWQW
ncbi:unnamed protein product [Gongylonema pulchrum]|uniref:Uncharacterized protein n=1 Tax=Gongylonema pulchrum TaxID=637853 RepID=A0A183EGY6_9BILA|nr:unnamed protein product [Gongylonema pulchrum]